MGGRTRWRHQCCLRVLCWARAVSPSWWTLHWCRQRGTLHRGWLVHKRDKTKVDYWSSDIFYCYNNFFYLLQTSTRRPSTLLVGRRLRHWWQTMGAVRRVLASRHGNSSWKPEATSTSCNFGVQCCYICFACLSSWDQHLIQPCIFTIAMQMHDAWICPHSGRYPWSLGGQRVDLWDAEGHLFCPQLSHRIRSIAAVNGAIRHQAGSGLLQHHTVHLRSHGCQGLHGPWGLSQGSVQANGSQWQWSEAAGGYRGGAICQHHYCIFTPSLEQSFHRCIPFTDGSIWLVSRRSVKYWGTVTSGTSWQPWKNCCCHFLRSSWQFRLMKAFSYSSFFCSALYWILCLECVSHLCSQKTAP